MSDEKISSLPNASALGGTEQLAGVQSGGNVNVTPAQIKTFTSASPTLVTPNIGVATATSFLSGASAITNEGYAVTPTVGLLIGWAATADGVNAAYFELDCDPASNGGRYTGLGMDVETIGGNTKNIDVLSAGYFFAKHGGTGIVSDLICGEFFPVSPPPTGTVTSMYGVLCRTPYDAGGDVITAYGIYLEDQNVATTNYQIYSAGTAPASFGGPVVTRAVHVADLPSASASGIGARHFVDDALTTLALGLGTTIANGGANKVPVYSDGTNWKYG